jgi:hypothetical protein
MSEHQMERLKIYWDNLEEKSLFFEGEIVLQHTKLMNLFAIRLA